MFTFAIVQGQDPLRLRLAGQTFVQRLRFHAVAQFNIEHVKQIDVGYATVGAASACATPGVADERWHGGCVGAGTAITRRRRDALVWRWIGEGDLGRRLASGHSAGMSGW